MLISRAVGRVRAPFTFPAGVMSVACPIWDDKAPPRPAPPLPAWIDAVISNLTAAQMAGMTEATMIAPVDGGFGADECRRACQADIITAVVSITIQRTLGELARCSLARSHTECLCNGSRAACGRLTIPRLAPHARSRATPPRLPIIISKRAMQQASEHTCHKARAI